MVGAFIQTRDVTAVMGSLVDSAGIKLSVEYGALSGLLKKNVMKNNIYFENPFYRVRDDHNPEFLPTDEDKEDKTDRNKPYRRICLTCQLCEDGRCKLKNTFLTDYDLEHKSCRMYRQMKHLRGTYLNEEDYDALYHTTINELKPTKIIKKF